MSPADWAGIASAGAAWLALILAGISLYKQHKSDKRRIERETQEGQESKRADLSANLITVGKNNWRLKVFNRGKGTARNVRLVDIEESRSILAQDDIRHKFPVPILEQHQAVEIIAVRSFGSPQRAHIKLLWDDETGSDHQKELTPSF